MTDLQMDTTKDAALRLCAEVVEERDALKALVQDTQAYLKRDLSMDPRLLNLRHRMAILLARLDGRTAYNPVERCAKCSCVKCGSAR